MKKLVNIINNLYNNAISWGVSFIAARKELSEIIKRSGKSIHCEKIHEWTSKWSVLGRVNKDFYRVFSKYSGEDII